MTQRYFATTTPGFEDQLADEIDALGGRKLEKTSGGVEFSATQRIFYRMNFELRCANRVYMRLDEFRARDFPELYRKSRRVSWERLLDEGNQVFVRGSARQSHLIHTDRIAETVGEGLREHFEKNLNRAAPRLVDTLDPDTQLVLARLEEDRCQLSLDSSGEHLFKRGWRQHPVEAPIRETLAAALLIRTGWIPRKPLLDPFCGSGTFLVEGAWMVNKRPPGDMRSFAFQRWANYRDSLWEDVVEVARKRHYTLEQVQFYGFDANPEAVDAATKNVEIAGTSAATQISLGDVADLVPPCEERGMIISNPPYGERLARGKGKRAAYQILIERFAEHFVGWRMGLVLPAEVEPGHDRLKFKEDLRFQNGGIHVRFWLARHR